MSKSNALLSRHKGCQHDMTLGESFRTLNVHHCWHARALEAEVIVELARNAVNDCSSSSDVPLTFNTLVQGLLNSNQLAVIFTFGKLLRDSVRDALSL